MLLPGGGKEAPDEGEMEMIEKGGSIRGPGLCTALRRLDAKNRRLKSCSESTPLR